MTSINYNKEMRIKTINNINNIINSFDIVNRSFYNTFNPRGYSCFNELDSLKNDILKMEEDLKKYKSKLVKAMNEIDRSEIELSSKIAAIDEILIEKLSKWEYESDKSY